MEETPRNHEDGGQERKTGAEVLSEMPSFEEHMENVERRADIGEKYYEQAKEEREKWVDMARGELRYWEELKPEDVKVYQFENDAIYMAERWQDQDGLSYRSLDVSDPREVGWFEKRRKNMIDQAKDRLEDDENTDLDELAKCFKNQEMIEQIGARLENGEEFTDEEVKFLGNAPDSDDEYFDTNKFLTPDVCYEKHHGFYTVPDYSDLLDKNSRAASKRPQ